MDNLQSVKRQKLIQALLLQPTNELAFKQAGISRGTGYAMMSDRMFQVELAAACAQYRKASDVRLSGLAVEAVETLADLLKSENGQLRLRAALGILERTDKQAERAEDEISEFAETMTRAMRDAPDSVRDYLAKVLDGERRTG